MLNLIDRAALTDAQIVALPGEWGDGELPFPSTWRLNQRTVADVATGKAIRVALEAVEETLVKAGEQLLGTGTSESTREAMRAAIADFARMKAQIQERE